jgi:hypothetical protein
MNNVTVVTNLRDYLTWVVASREKLIGRPPNVPYSCMEDFVLQEGTLFDHFSPRISKYKMGYPQLCFQNAYNLARRSRGNLSYVEGYAQGSILAVHHAWTIDKDGGIVDPTWYGRVDAAPSDYMGVTFPIELVREVRSREATVIDDWQQDWPMLKKKYTQ